MGHASERLYCAVHCFQSNSVFAKHILFLLETLQKPNRGLSVWQPLESNTLLFFIGDRGPLRATKAALRLNSSACGKRHNQPATALNFREQKTAFSITCWLLLKQEGPTPTTKKQKQPSISLQYFYKVSA